MSSPVIIAKPLRRLDRLYQHLGRRIEPSSMRVLGTLPRHRLEAIYRQVVAKLTPWQLDVLNRKGVRL